MIFFYFNNDTAPQLFIFDCQPYVGDITISCLISIKMIGALRTFYLIFSQLWNIPLLLRCPSIVFFSERLKFLHQWFYTSQMLSDFLLNIFNSAQFYRLVSIFFYLNLNGCWELFSLLVVLQGCSRKDIFISSLQYPCIGIMYILRHTCHNFSKYIHGK